MTKKRLKTLLYNAIAWIDEECSNFFASEIENEYEWYEKTLDITKDELNELGISWIKEAPEKIESFKPYPAMAYIHSLNGEMREVTVIDWDGFYNYVVLYNGVKCSAILNQFNFQYYADDKYGIIKE